MLAIYRQFSRLPLQACRTYATKRSPIGPRGSIRRPPPTPRRVPPQRNRASQSPKDEQSANSTPPSSEPSKNEAVSRALAEVPDSQNSLATPVHMPEDPHAVLKETHPVMKLLDNSAIVVQRKLEMMNVLLGFEQANRYVLMDPHGNHIGYLAEQDHGLGTAMARQMFRTHRSFTTHVFDREEKEVLRFHRPFAWINSRIRVYDAVGKDDSAYSHSVALQGTSAQSVISQTSASVSNLPLSEMRIIGAAEQEWGLLRRKYNLFLARVLNDTPAPLGTQQIASGDLPLSNSKALQVMEGDQREPGMMQFARVDEPFLSWDFSLMSEDGRRIGSVNRNFSGFARELFTDTGVYALRMDAAGLVEPGQTPSQDGNQVVPYDESHPGMTLDQRAIMLATAVSIDFDYFSRHSSNHSGLPIMWPLWLPGGGGGAAAGEAGAAGAGAAGAGGAVGAAGETGVVGEAGAAAGRYGVGEGAVTGAATMAGYEAMQRSRGGSQETQTQEADPQSPQAGGQDQYPMDQQPPSDAEQTWGQGRDPWANDDGDDFWGSGGRGGGGSDSDPGSGGGSGGGGGGDGDGDFWGDIF